MSRDMDDEFVRAARQAEEEEHAKKNAKNSQGSVAGNFVEIKWSGFTETPQTKVLRFVGKHPDLHYGSSIPNSSNTDARVINMSRIIADNGKQMDLILPLYDRQSNHIMWRIIDRVNTVEWRKVADTRDPKKTNSVKVYPNADRFPDIYNIVNYSGLPPDNKQRKFGLIGKGWKGREVLIANIIDREIMDWHRENKHTVLLAKKINKTSKPDGSFIEFVERGVPSYGLNSLLNNLRKTYGDWEKYDIGFTRTGSKDSPNTVFNATRTPEQVFEALQDLISSDTSLTAEEATWELYDLSRLFKVTSYTKLWNRLHLTIERIDACFNTHYADELKKLSEEETNSFNDTSPTPDSNEVYDDTAQEDMEESNDVPESKPIEPPSSSRRVVRTGTIENVQSSPQDLPAWKILTPSEQKGIDSVEAPAQGSLTWKIKYNNTVSSNMASCPDCDTQSPENYGTCPGCGARFS